MQRVFESIGWSKEDNRTSPTNSVFPNHPEQNNEAHMICPSLAAVEVFKMNFYSLDADFECVQGKPGKG